MIDIHSSWETMHKSYDSFAEITFLTIKGEEYITFVKGEDYLFANVGQSMGLCNREVKL